ncbi:hypothetical protein [Xanthomonas phage vB_XooS_NR08]|nr:hypothetical protein [Xanthomonas phage vB_XooS_NR08]
MVTCPRTVRASIIPYSSLCPGRARMPRPILRCRTAAPSCRAPRTCRPGRTGPSHCRLSGTGSPPPRCRLAS